MKIVKPTSIFTMIVALAACSNKPVEIVQEDKTATITCVYEPDTLKKTCDMTAEEIEQLNAAEATSRYVKVQ